jgi:hypothetical protein
MISTTVGTPVTERSVKTWLEPDLLSQRPLAMLNRITVTLALAVAEHLDNSDRSGRAKLSQHDIDNGLIAIPRLFLKDNLIVLKPRFQPEPVPQGFDLYQFLHLIFPSMTHGMTDTAAASMLSVSRSLITKIKNRKLNITRITAKGLAEKLEAAWHLMMDETPPTLGDDWEEMLAAEELEFVEDVEWPSATATHGPEPCLAAGRAGRSRMRKGILTEQMSHPFIYKLSSNEASADLGGMAQIGTKVLG